MRKVLYRLFIPLRFDDNVQIIEGTNCYSDYIYEGLFHQWVNADYELKALVEIVDGTVILLNIYDIKFITKRIKL